MQVYLKQGDQYFKVHYCQGTDKLSGLFEFDLRIGVFDPSDTCTGLDASKFITNHTKLQSNTLKNQMVTLVLSDQDDPDDLNNLYFHGRIAGVKANRLGAFSGSIISIKIKPENWQGFANQTVRVFDCHETTENDLNIKVSALSISSFEAVVNRLVSHASKPYVTDFDFSSDITAAELSERCASWWQNLILFQYKESSESALLRLLDRSQLFYQYDYKNTNAKYILRKRHFTPDIADEHCTVLTHSALVKDITDLDSDEALSIDYHFHDYHELDNALQATPSAALDNLSDDTLENSVNTSDYDPESEAVTQNRQLQPKYSGISHKVIGLNKTLKIVIESSAEETDTLYCMPVSLVHRYDPSASDSTTYQCEFESIFIKEGGGNPPSMNVNWWFDKIIERHQQLLATVKAASATSSVGDRDSKNRYLVEFEFCKGAASAPLKPQAWLYRMRPYTGAEGSGETYPLQAGSKVVLGFFQGNSDQPVILGSMALQDSNPENVFPLIANNEGKLTLGSTPKEGISRTNISDQEDYIYQTVHGEKYNWNEGNTYTFGGSRDYGYGNGYEVGIAEYEDEKFLTWDGSFPNDIVAPKSTGSCEFKYSDYPNSFNDLPSLYKVSVEVPSYFMGKAKFDPNDNGVSKNVGHNYEYQLGDVYSIQMSKQTNEVTAIDCQYNYETLGKSRNYSLVGSSVNMDAHGAEVDLAVRGAAVALDVNLLQFDMEYVGAHFEYSYKGLAVSYEQAIKNYSLLDRPEFKISDESLQSLTSKKVETIAKDSIILQVDNDTDLMAMPPSLLGGRSGVGNAISDLLPMTTWLRTLFGGSKKAENLFNALALKTDFNGDRDNTLVPKRKLSTDGKYSRLDINPTSLGLVSFDSSNTIQSEVVCSSGQKLIEFNVRPADQKINAKIKNLNQRMIQSTGSFVSSYYESDQQFSKLWFSKDAYAGDADITENSAGLFIQDKADSSSKMQLDTGGAVGACARFEVKDSAEEKAELVLFGVTNTLKIAKSATEHSEFHQTMGTGHWKSKKSADEFELSYTAGDKATLKVKKSANESLLELTSTNATLEGKSNVEIKSGSASVKANDAGLVAKAAKVEITASSGNAKLSGAATEISGNTKVEIKAGGTTATFSAASLDFKSATLGLKGSGPVQITGAIIKLG